MLRREETEGLECRDLSPAHNRQTHYAQHLLTLLQCNAECLLCPKQCQQDPSQSRLRCSVTLQDHLKILLPPQHLSDLSAGNSNKFMEEHRALRQVVHVL